MLFGTIHSRQPPVLLVQDKNAMARARVYAGLC